MKRGKPSLGQEVGSPGWIPRVETAHREERVPSSDPSPLASAGWAAGEVTTCELQFTRSRSSRILPREAELALAEVGENPGVQTPSSPSQV